LVVDRKISANENGREEGAIVISAVLLGKAALIAQMGEAAVFFFNIEKLTFGN